MYKQGNNLHYTVRGRGQFPVAMLAYDRCRAASDRDRQLIDAHADAYTDSSNEVEIALIMPNADRRLPSADRWGSFQWEVVGSTRPDSDEARVARMRCIWDELLLALTPEQREAMDYFRPKRVI